MLTKVEVRSALGLLLTLPLDDVSDGLVLEDIQGLDPVKAVLVSSSFASLDGAQYQSSRRETRNILMVLGLVPDFATTTVRDLRNNLYNFFMPKSEVHLRFFMTDDLGVEELTVDITGRVESFESPLFAKDPVANISILCFDPDFVELSSLTVSGNTVATSTEFSINYPGTVEAGFVFKLLLNRAESDFAIYHRGPDDVVKSLQFAASLLSGDVLTISTVTGDKHITLTRAASDSSLLYGRTPQSAWLELVKGVNHLRVYATGAAIPFTIEYTPRHGGL